MYIPDISLSYNDREKFPFTERKISVSPRCASSLTKGLPSRGRTELKTGPEACGKNARAEEQNASRAAHSDSPCSPGKTPSERRCILTRIRRGVNGFDRYFNPQRLLQLRLPMSFRRMKQRHIKKREIVVIN